METPNKNCQLETTRINSSQHEPTPLRQAEEPVTSESKGKLEILHQCEDFVVINKPINVRIINKCHTEDVTVQTMLRTHGFSADRPDKLGHQFYFVHKLDYRTSGPLCVALTKRGARSACYAFENRLVVKKYVAIVSGHIDLETLHSLRGVKLDKDKLTIDVPIARDSTITDLYMVATFNEDEQFTQKKNAITELVITRKGEYEGRPATEVLLTLQTGRTHQLRVHLKYIGHIIVGDFTYSDKTDNSPIRMMLHNTLLKFDCGFTCIDCESIAPFLNDDLWKPYEVGSY